ncbi:MAG: undecaprenyldiphospho-muramoylpentapeptide beta-N-acetylglucosaminyltransferase [bacterium]|nr:undecaprenyldiphospho-muramoylpentapeptide beta-N-acetylglucosaminyltransferase [bacterium]
MHVLFTGGGTAGHINPALSVADYLKNQLPEIKISYIGTADKLESKLVPEKGYDFYTIDVAGFQRKISLKNIKRNISALAKVITASGKAKKLLKKLKPDVVVGTGGYVCGPVLREAAKLGIKTVVHESNAIPGVTVKMLAPIVDRVLLSTEDAKKYLKCKNEPVITGNPVRLEITNADKAAARKKLGLDSRPLVLSFGGSLGARLINEAVSQLILDNRADYYIFHATGKSGYRTMLDLLQQKGYTEKENIKLFEYIADMGDYLAAADLVISRAGAITVSELQAAGKPSVLIPSPYVAENHQFFNAMMLKKRGAAEIIEEKDLSGQRLRKMVESLIFDVKKLKSMSDNAKNKLIIEANERICRVIFDLV